MVKQELQAEAVRLLVLLRAMYASRAQHHRVATTARCTRCDGSLPSPLHLAIKRNGFQMMFPPAATWTRAVGLRGLLKYITPPYSNSWCILTFPHIPCTESGISGTRVRPVHSP